jgi:hypothetical protein
MSQRSNNLTQLFAALLIALGSTGCQAPWTSPPTFSRIGAADHADAKHDSALKTVDNSSTESMLAEPRMPPPPAPKTADNERAMADVMQEVDRLGTADPAAQKMLLDELQHSKPELWPLVVQHFRSTASYHEQLVAKQAAPPAPDRNSNAVGRPANSAQLAASSGSGTSSAKIGELADPRGARSDAPLESAVAVATPANMSPPLDAEALAAAATAQKAPQPPATDSTARPLKNASTAAPSGAAQHPATQAIYEQSANATGSVKQALATTPAVKANAEGGPNADLTSSPGSRDWRQDVEQAIKDLQQRLPEAPQTTAEVHQHVSLRLLELLDGRTEDALKPIPQISHEEQDYWSGQIFALATFLDHHSQPDEKRRAAASVAHLDEAAGHLRELGSLALRNLTFCKHVYDFGAYEPYDEAQFSPGQQVTLYVEVENYHSDSTDKGYCTSLGTSYEVFDEQGKRVEGGDFPDVEDCCRSHRRDFHIQYGMSVPKKLSPGKYRLDLVMKDRRGDKLGHASIDFEIRGK